MGQQLDVWILPETASELGSVLAIAEHFEGRLLVYSFCIPAASWTLFNTLM
jgi:hypothetical protein